MTDHPDISPEARRAGRIWGAAIVLGLTSVVLVNVLFAWLARDHKIDLVSERYYQEGLDYDRLVAAGHQASRFALKIESGSRISIMTGDGSIIRPQTAAIDYYRADNPALDRSVTGNILDDGTISPGISLEPGVWTVTVHAVIDDQTVHLSTRWLN